MLDPLVIRQNLAVPPQALRWRAVGAGGPGGQHVNKTATKIELYLDFSIFSDYPRAALERLRLRAALRWTQEGALMIVESSERSQHRNLKRARERLAQLLREGLVRPKPRRATKPTKGSVRRRLQSKRERSQVKAGRQRVFRDS